MEALSVVRYVDALYTCLEKHNLKKENFLQHFGLTDFNHINEFWPAEQIVEYWRLAEVYLQRKNLSFEAGQAIQHSDLGLLVYALMNCKTLGEAYELSLLYEPLTGNVINSVCEIKNGLVKVTIKTNLLSDEKMRHFVEFNIAAAKTMLTQLSPHGNNEVSPSFSEVHFKHKLSGELKAYEDYFSCPVKFGRPENIIIFSEEIFLQKIEKCNSNIKDFMVKKIDEFVVSENERRDRQLSFKMKAYIRSSLGGTIPSFEEAAQSLNMSMSTFRRRLNREGTNYIELSDEVRQSAATKLLAGSLEPVDNVAAYLDYSDLSSFSRAFRRWYDCSPSEYRKRYQMEES